MKKHLFIAIFVLAIASMLVSFPLYSQDKDLLARADALHKQGFVLVEEEKYEEAIILLEKAVEIRKKWIGNDSAKLAAELNLLGVCHGVLGNIVEALDFFMQSLEFYSIDDPNYAACLDNIGNCYLNLGNDAKALEYYLQELAVWEKVYGKEHLNYALCLDIIGNCYQNLSNDAKALEYYQQELAIGEKVYGKEHPDYAICLDNIGNCYHNLSNYAKALEYYQQELAIWEKVYGKEHPDYATVLDNIGGCYQDRYDYAKALEYHQKALAIREKVNGKEHPDYAISLYNIGTCYRGFGDYAKALEYSQQALAIIEIVYGKEHPDYAKILNNIGVYYQDLGNYVKALEYHQKALASQEKVYGKEHPDYVMSLHNIGICYRVLGDYAKALEYHQQSLAIREKIYDKDHPAYAKSLNSIGSCYLDLGDYAKALEYYQQARAIWEKVYGKEHPDYATSLNNIGACYSGFGDYAKTLEYYQQARAIWEKVYGKKHPAYANSLRIIGACYHDLGDDVKALEYHQKALSIREKVHGKENPDYATSLYNIGVCYYTLGNDVKASEYISSFSATTSSIVTYSFYSLTESQRALFWDGYSQFFTNRLYDYSTTISSPEMNRTAYDGALFGKGLLLNAETEMRKLILESGDEEALRMYNEVQESRVKLDKLYEDPVGKKDAIDSLNTDIEKRQQELMKRSKVFGDYTRNLALKWTDVQAALGKKDIAIEFEAYTHKDTTFYIALTLRPEYTEPHLVELFDSKDLGGINSNRYYTSTSMTCLVWGKLAEELAGVQNVYFSPAGELNNIGIEYMLDEDGKHLISEKRNYYRLTSTRELVKEHSGKKMTDATLYGGIRYDITPSSKLIGNETESERLALTATRSWLPMDSLPISRGGWMYLPGTKEEVESISATLSSQKVHNDLLEGANGTEESFKALSGAKKDVIHIATHGFYWTETEAARSRMKTSSFMLDNESQAPKEDKALTRSGLLFAGAQNAFKGKDIPIDVEDGILTAKDISRLDLRGTDLVVLSACQSGLGEVTGDGVFGLQRGFKKAGVQSIVMSLWEVSDEATKIMMTRFYENLARGRSKYDSFRDAQYYLRKYDNGLYDEPEYYAAFVLLDAIN